VVINAVEQIPAKDPFARKTAGGDRNIVWVNKTLTILGPTNNASIVWEWGPIHSVITINRKEIRSSVNDEPSLSDDANRLPRREFC
jgi:hypothetical protein